MNNEQNLTLEEYLKEKNTGALTEYQRYLNRHNLPKKDDTVVSLIAGFGGMAGTYLIVLGHSIDSEFADENYCDDHIILKGRGDHIYLATTSKWWEEIEVVGKK